MLIGYSMPQVVAISLSGGAGAAWLTADAGDACCDGKPARRARLRWRNDAAPSTAHSLAVVFDIAQTPLRIFAMLGLVNVPIGTKVEITGKRPADGGPTWNFGGGNTGTVVGFPDGSRGAWFVVPAGAAAVEEVAFRFYNDNAGSTWATAATMIDIGELVAMPAMDVPHESDWTDEMVDPSLSSITIGSQRATVARPTYRTFSGYLSADSVGPVRGGGLANGMDWETLRAALRADARCVGIPRWQLPTGAVDVAALNRSALYATGRLSGITHLGGDYYSGAIALQEVPA